MTTLEYEKPKQAQLAHWLARGLSLLFIGFNLLLLVLNEDFRNSPTLPAVVLCILALSTLFAWRWETAGGLVTLFLSPIFLLSLFVQWSGTAGLSLSIWELALIGVCMMFPFLIIGLLFVHVGRQSQ